MRARRYLWGTALFAAILMIALFMLRLPLASYGVSKALASAGVEDAQFRMAAISPGGARIEDFSVSAEGRESINLESVEVDFDWRSLLRRRQIDAVRIGAGAVEISIADDGAISIPGVTLGDGSGGGSAPFQSLSISELNIIAHTPAGTASGVASLAFDMESGGHGTITVSAPRAGFSSFAMENASARADLNYDPSAGAQLDAVVEGDVIAQDAPAGAVQLTINATDLLWRGAGDEIAGQLLGHAAMRVNATGIPTAAAPALSFLGGNQAESLLGSAITSLSASGALTMKNTEAEGLSLASSGEAPLIIQGDNGVVLALAANEAGAPLFQRNNGGDLAAFGFELSGARIDARGEVDAEKTGEGWRVKSPLSFGAFQSERLEFESAAAVIDAVVGASQVNAHIAVETNLIKGKVGRLNVYDAPIDVAFNAVADRTDRRAVISPEGACFTVDELSATIDRQDTEIFLSDARFCGADEPAVVVDWRDALKSTLVGRLSASHARYRLGNTRLVGAPPHIDATAVYTPSLNQTVMDGAIEGGRMALNELLFLEPTSSAFTFSLDKEIMRADLRGARMRVSQQRDPPLVAPVWAIVDLSLENRDIDFSYVLTTLSGARIGQGVGVHDVTSSSGQSRLTLDDIVFELGGMQPAALLPVLRGIARQATGAATGIADFSWTRGGGIQSSADIALANMSFVGPTRIVNKTTGLEGEIQFSALWPLTTNGVQTLTVEGADLDALQLQSGEISFEMQGDEQLRVERAAFPWFGGELGVDSAVMSMSGGEAVAPLRASGIDLEQIFTFADIDGLSGEGILSGALPLVVEGGKARIENGILKSDGPGAIRYEGRAGEEAGSAGGQAKMAFDLLRDLRYESLEAKIDGPLDGRLQFQINLEGTGEIEFNAENVRVPVNYHINLDAALLELLNQANLSRRIELQLQQGVRNED